MKRCMVLIVTITQLVSAVPTDTIEDQTWETNGTVYSIVTVGNSVYIGGEFTKVGPLSGFAVPVSAASGVPLSTFPKIRSKAFCLCSDNNGGWYIGSDKVYHLLSSGSLDSKFNRMGIAGAGDIHALALDGTTLYVGGSFGALGGQIRTGLAAIDVTTGTVLSWDPNPSIDNNIDVKTITVSATAVYLGGKFTTLNGVTRNNAAAVHKTTGSVLAWNPNADNTVTALLQSGVTLYAGGLFTQIGGQARGKIASLDSSTGTATSFNPGANDDVMALAVSGTTLYAGGKFTQISGQTRNRIAALDKTTGTAALWNPNANGPVLSLAVNGSTIYAAGGFTAMGGGAHDRVAGIDSATGNASSWEPGASDTVRAVGASGGTVYLCGDFILVGGITRNGVAEIDPVTGAPTSWNPGIAGTVKVLAATGSTLFAGGSFTSIAGQTRNNIGTIGIPGGTVTSWNPNANGAVNALAVKDSTVWAGGSFTSIGGASRNYLAALSISTGSASSWNPAPNDTIVGMSLTDSTLYVAGAFYLMGSYQPRNYAASFKTSTGAITGWNPNSMNPGINSISAFDTTVYVAGNQQLLKAFSAKTGTVLPWNASAGFPSSYRCVTATKTAVYVGGSFDSIGGAARSGLAELDPITGTATAWNPGSGAGWMYCIHPVNNVVFVGGRSLYGMGKPDTLARYYFAQFGRFVPIPTLLSPADNAVNQSYQVLSLAWNAVSGASSYRVQVSTSPVFSSTVVDDSTVTGTTKTIGSLAILTTYYWRVLAKKSGKTSGWSTVWRFTTSSQVPDIPLLSSPALGAADQPTTLIFSWLASANALTYRLQIATDSTFNTVVFNDSTCAGTTRAVGSLSPSTTHYWRVNAKNLGGYSGWSNVWWFTTSRPVPAAPTLLSPASASINQPLTATLAWNSVPYAATYRLQLATNSSFTTPVVDDSAISGPSRVVGPLAVNATYYWRVNAKNPSGTGGWSEVWYFTTAPGIPATPTLAAPANNAVNQPLTPTLSWNPVTTASTYRIQLSKTSDFSVPVLDDSALTAASKTAGTLENGTLYYWRVNAKNAGGPSPWSVAWNFTTLPAPPGMPLLVSPANGVMDLPLACRFTWNRVANTSSYRVQVSPDTTFTSLAVDDSTLVDTAKVGDTLLSGTVYYWRVNAKNPAGSGNWSAVWSFTTLITAPVQILPANNATGQPLSTVLTWGKVTGASNYRVQVTRDPAFNALFVDDSSCIADSATITSLSPLTIYYWRVKAQKLPRTGPWSSIRSFMTMLTTPNQVTIAAPAHGAVISSDSMTFSWHVTAPVADRYCLEIFTDSLRTNKILADSMITDTAVRVKTPPDNKSYWWTVRAQNTVGWGLASVARKFAVNMANANVLPKQFSCAWTGAFRNASLIRYGLPAGAMVSIKLYNIQGKLVRTLHNSFDRPGYHQCPIVRTSLSRGNYLLQFKAGPFQWTKKTVFQ